MTRLGLAHFDLVVLVVVVDDEAVAHRETCVAARADHPSTQHRAKVTLTRRAPSALLRTRPCHTAEQADTVAVALVL